MRIRQRKALENFPDERSTLCILCEIFALSALILTAKMADAKIAKGFGLTDGT
jgi:hypothetical protein